MGRDICGILKYTNGKYTWFEVTSKKGAEARLPIFIYNKRTNNTGTLAKSEYNAWKKKEVLKGVKDIENHKNNSNAVAYVSVNNNKGSRITKIRLKHS